MTRSLRNLQSVLWKGLAARDCASMQVLHEFKRVKNGLGVAILSTSKGVMTDKQAKTQNVGGEVLCYIY